MAMTLLPYTKRGTATAVVGDPVIVFQDAPGEVVNLLQERLRPGDRFESEAGQTATILSVDAAKQVTLDRPYKGTAQAAAPYKIWRTSDSEVIMAAALEALDVLGRGGVQAFAALNGGADKLPYFDGANTMALADFKSWARQFLALAATSRKGVRFDASVPPQPALFDLTDFALTLLDDLDAAAMRRTLGINSDLGQTGAPIRARGSSPAVEFGHSNQNGYASVLGHNVNNGMPFLAFNCEPGTTPETYRTRGIAGSVIRSRGDGGVDFLRIPNVNADNQAPVVIASINSAGALLQNGVKLIEYGAVDTNRYARFADGTQICYYSWPGGADISFPVGVGATALSGAFGFLAAFTEAPYIAYSGYVTDAGGQTLMLPILDASVTGGVNYLTQCKWGIRNNAAVAVTRIVFFRFFAIGRWF